ncbi:MAG: RNA polymerase sigma-70 factor (ECF subfamily) [Polyangiales bacterium]
MELVKASKQEREGDQVLVRRCLEKDASAQRELFQRLKRTIHRTLYRIMGSNAQLPDLIQDSFLEVFRSLSSFQGRSKLDTWADTIAARVAYRYLSTKTRRPSHLRLVEDVSEDRSTDESRYAARRGVESLYGILDRLEAKYRIAYTLYVIDERSMAEVAAVTEVSLVAAKNRVWRARKMVTERANHDVALRAFITKELR